MMALPWWFWTAIGIAWFVGLVSLPILAMVGVPLLPAKFRRPFVNIWTKLAMLTAERAMLIFRRDGSYQLLPSSYDAEKEAEIVKIDGEERSFTDSHGLMGSLARRKLGIAVEEVSAVLNPAVVAIGEAQEQKLADGQGHVEAYWDTDEPEAGEERGQPVAAMNPYTRLKNTDVVVDMRKIWSILSGSSDSDLAQRTQKRTLASQAKHGGDRTIKMAALLGGALLLGWVLRDISIPGGGGGGSVINVPFAVVPSWAFDAMLAVAG